MTEETPMWGYGPFLEKSRGAGLVKIMKLLHIPIVVEWREPAKKNPPSNGKKDINVLVVKNWLLHLICSFFRLGAYIETTK